MKKKNSIAFLLISVVLWISLIPRNYGGINGLPSFKCIQAEREALLRFRGSLTCTSSNCVVSSWKGEDCCIWEGIACDNTTGHVIKLDLGWNQAWSNELDNALLDLKHLVYLNLGRNLFTCSIPEFIGSMKQLEHLDLSYSYFGGSVPHQLGNLTSLVYLDLSGNDFGRRPIPEFIGSMKQLEHLDLSDSSFGGSVPHQLGNLTSLAYLDLSFNDFVRSQIPEFIGSMKQLEHLDLSYSNFGGSVPHQLGNLTSLRSLDLRFNNISGEIPNFPSSLIYIDLSFNNITGYIPNFPSDLNYIDLSNNNIHGTIPNFPFNLQKIDLSHNNIYGIIPTLPSNLTNIDLSYNQISGGIPHFPTCLEFIILSHNQITGSIPYPIFHGSTPSRLATVDLSDNLISGPIPSDMFLASDMLLPQWNLLLANNHLNGTIPEALCRASNLSTLDLRGNRLSGMIPDCQHVSMLFIMLSSNQLAGPIPSSFLQNPNLILLDLSNNTLQGEIPSFVIGPYVEVIDLGGNNLSGTIQFPRMHNATGLSILRLRENHLEGILPSAICSVGSLRILDLADNNLTGNIPPCLGNFTGDSFDYIGDMSITEVIKGEVLEYTATLPFLVNVDLSANNLVGGIPDELVKSPGLVGLNLSYNHLTGSIPNKIGEMTKLESLDLSNNHLSGIIPQSMSDLSSLSHLNLSYNNLQGEIPTGNQLQTLIDPSIYIGNQGLCGEPLPKKCKGGDNQPKLPASTASAQEHVEDHEKLWFYLVIAAGFTTGFWGVIGTLVVKKTWRHAYFKTVEDLFDRIYALAAITKNKLKEKITNRKSDG